MFPEAPNPNPQLMKPLKSYFMAFLVAFFVALVFLGTTVWTYLGKSSAEKNLDDQIAIAVSAANAELTSLLQSQFAEESKLPNKEATFVESLGGVTISYPKTWSVYAIEDSGGSLPLDLYSHPDEVPDIDGKTAFGLRLAIVNKTYNDEVDNFARRVKDGQVSAKPVNLNDTLGTKFQGEILKDKNGIIVLFPIRDKTLKLWTESSSFITDFNNVLDSLIFQP